MHKHNHLPRFLTDGCISLTGVLGTLWCVITAFHIDVLALPLIAGAAAFCALFSACLSWKKARWLLLPAAAAAVWLLFFTSFGAAMQDGAAGFASQLLSRFSRAYGLSVEIPMPEPEPQAAEYTVFFLAVAAFSALWMSWGVHIRSCLLSMAGSLPFLLLCVIVNDTLPSVYPLIALTAVWLTLLLADIRQNDTPGIAAGRTILLFMAVLVLVSVVGIVYPKDTEDQDLPVTVQNMLEQMPGNVQNALSRESSPKQNSNIGEDTTDKLDLTRQGAREITGDTLLRVSASEPGTFYLRTNAKDVYTGSSWESADGADAEDAVYAQTSLGQAFGAEIQAGIQIQDLSGQDTFLYTPYGYIDSSAAEEIRSDLYINTTQEDYVVYFWPGLSELDLSTRGIAQADYDRYVQQTDTELPEDTREQLLQIAYAYGYEDTYSEIDKIAWAAEFARTAASYNLNTGLQPADADFAVYFLTTSRAGYCVHFATATAALLRAMGIPARYATGYRVEAGEAGEVVDVTDANAHAWAEVYISGLGWLPLESTPGFGESLNLPAISHEPTLQEGASVPTYEPAAAASPSPEGGDGDGGESTPEPSPEDEPVPSAAEESAASFPLRRILLCTVGALLAALLILLIRKTVVERKRRERIADANRKKAVVAYWAYLEDLIPYGADPSPLRALAQKAKFSQHETSEEEYRDFCRQADNIALKTARNVPGQQKIKFSLFRCLSPQKEKKGGRHA